MPYKRHDLGIRKLIYFGHGQSFSEPYSIKRKKTYKDSFAIRHKVIVYSNKD